VRLDFNQRLSVLASATGLILIVSYFIALYLGLNTSPWLPEMIAGTAGFELFLFGRKRWAAFRRRRANSRGGDRG